MGFFDIFSNTERDKRKSHLKNLLQVGLADGNLDQVELEYLISLAKELNMPQSEIDEVMQQASEIKFRAPANFDDKVNQLHDLVQMMMINGEIHDKEMKICKTLALKLDILPKMVDDIVKIMVERAAQGESYESISKELSSFNLN